jgi:hypothetical protein
VEQRGVPEGSSRGVCQRGVPEEGRRRRRSRRIKSENPNQRFGNKYIYIYIYIYGGCKEGLSVGPSVWFEG